MTSKVTALNTTQKIITQPVTGRVVVQPHVWYTCPAGAKAIIKGSVQCTGRGAAATADLLAAGEILFRWDRNTAIIANYIDGPRTLSTINGGQMAFFEVQLAAGETLNTAQDVGANAEFNIFAKVQETPA